MLNEQLQTELDQEAKAEAKKLTARVPAFRFGYEAGHYDGAEKYAEKWQEAQQRAEHLEQWKKEAKMLLDPILDWGQANKNVPLGASITEEVLRRAKEYNELKEKVERYEKINEQINNMAFIKGVPGATWGDTEYDSLAAAAGYNQAIMNMKEMILKSLTPKTGSDDTTNG